MGKPTSPETIVILNKYYPNGLKEIDVWNHYQKEKSKVLRECQNRDVMIFVMTDVNKPVVLRKRSGSFIRLTSSNYDTLITGRTVSIHAAMSKYEDFGIVDVDLDPRDGFSWAKEVTLRTYDYLMDKVPVIKSATIRYTGKKSFHVVCYFARKMKIDSIRFLLRKSLLDSPLAKVYTIAGKRHPGVPNLDLSPNKFRGNFIVPGALSVWGLKCMDVNYSDVPTFNPYKALVR